MNTATPARIVLRAITAATVVVTAFLPLFGSDVDSVFPGKTWAERSPEEVGLDAEKLNAFSKFVGGRGCVVRHGYLVYAWGDVGRRADVASAAKPVYSHFLFKALEDGKIEGLDEKVIRWEPRLENINKPLSHKDRDITWRHFANQTSCYQLKEKPGTAYAYNDWQMALFWDTLFLEVYGATYDNVDEKVLHPLLTDLIQCEDRPTLMAFGTKNRPGRLAISVRDFARFGLLYLREGDWNGKQLLSRKHARLAVTDPVPNSLLRAGKDEAEMIPGQRSIGSGDTPDNQTEHFGSYSWLWWINGVDGDGTRMWPDAPADTFGAFGHGGPRAMWVVPSWDIVVSYNDANLRRWSNGNDSPTNRAMKLLAEAVTDRVDAAVSPDEKTFAKWTTIEIAFEGATSRGRGEPNPFGVRLDATFTSPTGKRVTVPGFYDGDGRGGLDGNIWKVRFSADEPGTWNYKTAGSHERLDGLTGRFTVTDVPHDARGFWKWGRLEYTGTAENGVRYLKFRDGPYWLKAGCDDPENFLGRYHNFDTLDKRKAAVDYLAERGVNSLYMMTHNLDGDDRDVWPWLGETQNEAKTNGGRNARFDVAKLHEWRQLFEHMQTVGVVPYLVLEDDSAWKGYDHERYYRELIARFGDLPAVLFNLGEEHNENYRLSDALSHLKRLAEIDAYNHPRGIHNVNRPENDYIDAPHVHFTSIQTGSPGSRRGLKDAMEHNRLALDWIERCRQRNRRVLMVNFDEGRPEEHRAGWWSAYLAGGVWEVHVREPYDRPYSAWEPAWTQIGGARAFLESVPYWQMQPHNELVTSGSAYCLADPGANYALYLPEGGTITVRLEDGQYKADWWNPANGRDGKFVHLSNISGGQRQFQAPGSGDWALRIVKDPLPEE